MAKTTRRHRRAKSQSPARFAPAGSIVILGNPTELAAPSGIAARGTVPTKFAKPTGRLGRFAPPANVPLGFAPPADVPLGFAAPGDVPLGFAAPGDVPLGFAPPSPVVVGFVGPSGVVVRISKYAGRPESASRLSERPSGGRTTINAWQADPGAGVTVVRPVPKYQKGPWAFNFPGKAPVPGRYAAGTEDFRFWTAAEALRRGADFWTAIIGKAAWRGALALPVNLDAGQELNAYYDRKALKFFHADTPYGTVYSGESPDIVCHELGHAVLDRIKPNLWGAASHEASAFHEAFGDISAILCGLQLPEMRRHILAETGGRLYQSSQLSRLAMQLGAAIRLIRPQDVDQDCLRNVVNSFTYFDPVELPHHAPAAQLSSEAHSFSRVFSGAFFEAVAGLLSVNAKKPDSPTEAELERTSTLSAQLLVAAIRNAPIVSNFFAQIAAEMIRQATRRSTTDAAVLRAIFVRRSILSLECTAHLENIRAFKSIDEQKLRNLSGSPLDFVTVDARTFGLSRPLSLEAPSHPRVFAVTAAGPNARAIDPISALTAARGYANDIVRLGRVDFSQAQASQHLLHSHSHFFTHCVTPSDGALRLERRCFDCGLRRD